MDGKGLAPSDRFGRRVANETLEKACQEARASCLDLYPQIERHGFLAGLTWCNGSAHSTLDATVTENGTIVEIDCWVIFPGVDPDGDQVVGWFREFLTDFIQRKEQGQRSDSTWSMPSDPTLDIRLSVMCGQVFRWRELPDGRLFGADGDDAWIVDPDADAVKVWSTGPRRNFNRYFCCDIDWSAAATTLVKAGPELAPYVGALPGLRLLRPSDAVEEAFSFLCTSNNNLVRIQGMVDALASYGPLMASVNGHDIHRFPMVERIAGIPEAELRDRGFGYRAATIPVAARQIVERGGKPWLEGLKALPYTEARASLQELSGVGPKLADCLCLFALGHDEAVPVDTHLWQAATRLYFPDLVGTSLTANRYRQVGDHFRNRFGKLAGWAHQFLFYENLLNWRSRRPQKHEGPPA